MRALYYTGETSILQLFESPISDSDMISSLSSAYTEGTLAIATYEGSLQNADNIMIVNDAAVDKNTFSPNVTATTFTVGDPSGISITNLPECSVTVSGDSIILDGAGEGDFTAEISDGNITITADYPGTYTLTFTAPTYITYYLEVEAL